jgi:hypothetical protein
MMGCAEPCRAGGNQNAESDAGPSHHIWFIRVSME